MSSTSERVYSYIDEHKDDFVEELGTLLSQPSISTLGVGIRETAAMVVTMMERSGLRTRVIETSGHPFIFGEAATDRSRPTILIYGHYDVQPVEPLDAWETPPFKPTIRDGRIYARGAGDNKGQLVAQLLGMRCLAAVAGSLPVNVKCIFEGEEENGSPHLEQVARENKPLLKADLAITADGPLHESGRPLLVFGVRGMVYVELIARGAKRDLHSGNWGGPIENPAWRLMSVLQSMKDADGAKVKVPGFYTGIRSFSSKERAALRKIPFDRDAVARDLGIPRSGISPPGRFYAKLMAEPTFNICGLRSGYTGEGSKTIIPATATAKLDMRLVPGQDPDEIFERVRTHIAKQDRRVEVRRLGSMKPSRTPLDTRYARPVLEAVRRASGREPIIYPSLGASLPDYVFTNILGIPSIITPYANHDESNHAPNENLKVDNFIYGIRCCASILMHLSESGAISARA